VIHRDIKPANILLTSREVYGSERPRITDFGIAKLVASEITTTGQLLGTPSYMPPEQFTGTPIDGRADLFSLGVILYSLATGDQPFPGETMTAVSYKIVYTEPVPPGKLNPAISPRLQSAILRCLAKNPAERYQTGEEIALDLAAIRTNSAASTLQPTAPPAAAVGISSSDVTLGPGPIAATFPPAQTVPPIGASLPPSAVSMAKKPAKAMRIESMFAVVLLGVAGVGAAAVGGWFWYQHHKQVVAEQQQPPQPPKPVPAPQPVQVTQPGTQPQLVGMAKPEAKPQPEASKPLATSTTPQSPAGGKSKTPAQPSAKPSPGKPAPAVVPPAAPPTVAAVTPVPPATKPGSAPAPAPKTSGAFEPHKLDPNKNAKLKIDLAKFPNGLQFTVEMNKETYLHFTTGDGSSLDNLYVPPGTQKFSAILRAGGQEWDSKVASEDFKAKKHSTLKIQLMEQGKALSKITLPIPKDAQLSVSVSTSLIDTIF
jgi:serine/threonine-protein kinase